MFWLVMALGVAAGVSIPEYRARLNSPGYSSVPL
jgi:hypothetical protein